MRIALHKNKRYSKLKRTKEIISILIAYGFNDLLYVTPILNIIGRPLSKVKIKHKGKYINELTRGEKIRYAFEELGTTFIKLGQILSSRKDLIPKDIIDELSKLQDNVAFFDEKESVRIIEEELELPISKAFQSFEYKPVASASISQVHKAVLHDGTEVAIKVKRPNIDSKVLVDIEIISWITELIEKYSEDFALLKPRKLIRTFSIQLQRELDFTYEKNNLLKFYNYFINNPKIKIPQVYKDYSTKNILTMEFIKGINVAEVKDNPKFDNVEIVSEIASSMLEQIFMINFFHADPHPGNIFILENNVVCYIDFGMVGAVPPSIKESLLNIISSLSSDNYSKLAYSILELCENKEISNFEDFEDRIFLFVNSYINMPLSDIDIEQIFNEIITILRDYNLSISSNLMMIFKSLIVLEGLGRTLNRDFKIMEHLKPFTQKYMKEQISPNNMVKQFKNILLDYSTVLKNMPSDISGLISIIKKGGMKIILEHKGLDALSNTLDKLADRLSYSIVLASLIISSALIIVAKIPPLFNGIPIIGMIGFGLSALFGFLMIIARFVRAYMNRNK